MAINFFVRKQKFSHVRQAFVFKISGKKISRQFPFSCVKSTKSSAARRNPPKRRSRRLTWREGLYNEAWLPPYKSKLPFQKLDNAFVVCLIMLQRQEGPFFNRVVKSIANEGKKDFWVRSMSQPCWQKKISFGSFPVLGKHFRQLTKRRRQKVSVGQHNEVNFTLIGHIDRSRYLLNWSYQNEAT